jgi:hypothetical protein
MYEMQSDLLFGANLSGGRVDGRRIQLAALVPEVDVWMLAGEAVVEARGAHAAGPEGAEYVGTYSLVGPVGPETPSYVRTAIPAPVPSDS